MTSAAASVFGLQPNTGRPAADKTKLPVEREKKPLVPRVTLLRFDGKSSERISMDTAGNRALKLVNKGAMTPQSREILQMLVW